MPNDNMDDYRSVNFSDVNVPARGAVMAPLFVEVIRTLTAEDIVALANNPELVPQEPTQKLRAVHHRMAMLLSEGKSISEVAAITSYTTARIGQLQKDPGFQNLMGYYHDQLITAHMEDAIRLQGKLVDIAEMAADEIVERLDDAETIKKVPLGELRNLMTMGADRTVAPPKSTTTVINPPHKITLGFGGKGMKNKTIDNDTQKVIDSGE